MAVPKPKKYVQINGVMKLNPKVQALLGGEVRRELLVRQPRRRKHHRCRRTFMHPRPNSPPISDKVRDSWGGRVERAEENYCGDIVRPTIIAPADRFPHRCAPLLPNLSLFIPRGGNRPCRWTFVVFFFVVCDDQEDEEEGPWSQRRTEVRRRRDHRYLHPGGVPRGPSQKINQRPHHRLLPH